MKTVIIIRNSVLLVLLAFLSYLMLEITLEYFPIRTKVAFLGIKQWVFRKYPGAVSQFWFTAFYIHVMTSMLVLLAGFTQFFSSLRHFKIHRWMGKTYILVVLFLSGPTGLIMGYFANGGPSSQTCFILLALLWIASTFIAFRAAVERKFTKHKHWMWISYSLALSALTLRLWKYGITNWTDLDMKPMDLYRMVAWLGWVPNLFFAVLLIALDRDRKKSKKNLLNEA